MSDGAILVNSVSACGIYRSCNSFSGFGDQRQQSASEASASTNNFRRQRVYKRRNRPATSSFATARKVQAAAASVNSPQADGSSKAPPAKLNQIFQPSIEIQSQAPQAPQQILPAKLAKETVPCASSRSKSMNAADYAYHMYGSQPHLSQLIPLSLPGGGGAAPDFDVPEAAKNRRRMRSAGRSIPSRRNFQNNDSLAVSMMDNIKPKDFFMVNFARLERCAALQSLKSTGSCDIPPSSAKTPPSAEQSANQESPPPPKSDSELVFAIGGVPLREALSGIFDRRNIILEKVHVFLEASATPLPYETDTSFLGGNRLYVKAKDSDSPFSRAAFYVEPTTLANVNQVQPSANQNAPFNCGDQLNSASSSSLVSSTSGAANQILSPTGSQSASAKSGGNFKGGQSAKDGGKDWRLPLTLTKKSKEKLLAISTTPNNDPLASPSGMQPSFEGQDPTSMTVAANSLTAAIVGDPSGSGPVGSVRKTRSQGRLSQIFPNSLFKQEKPDMQARLAQFQETGLPLEQLDTRLTCTGKGSKLPDLYLELHWSNIVTNSQNLSKRQAEQQEALWELVETELSYIKKLSILTEFLSCLIELQADGYLPDIDTELVFGNVPELHEANLRFWTRAVEPFLTHSRTTGEPLDPGKLEPGFSDVCILFEPYIKYSLTHASIIQYIAKKQKDSESFREFVTWAQSQKSAGRLQMTDLLVKPMQRLTKYPLLLKAILKNTADIPSRTAIANMNQNIEDFLNCINFELRFKQHQEALLAIMATIESYEGVDCTIEELAALIQPHHSLDLTTPMLGCHDKVLRLLFLQGDLKLRDAYSKADVHCFLFTDMFLVTKQLPRRNDRMRLKVVRPPFHIERVLVKELRDPSTFAFIYVNEFGVTASAFTLQASQPVECQKWVEFFRIARDTYAHYKENPTDFTWLPLTGNNNLEAGGLCFPASASQGPSGGPPGSSRPNSAKGTISAAGQHHLTVNGDQAGSTPFRRISMGAMESARRKLQEVQNAVHGRSVSMDSTVLAAKANGSVSEASSNSSLVNRSSLDEPEFSPGLPNKPPSAVSSVSEGAFKFAGMTPPPENTRTCFSATIPRVSCSMSDDHLVVYEGDENLHRYNQSQADSAQISPPLELSPPKPGTLASIRSMLSPGRITRRKSSSETGATSPVAIGEDNLGCEFQISSGESSPCARHRTTSPSQTLTPDITPTSRPGSSETLVPSAPITSPAGAESRSLLSRSVSHTIPQISVCQHTPNRSPSPEVASEFQANEERIEDSKTPPLPARSPPAEETSQSASTIVSVKATAQEKPPQKYKKLKDASDLKLLNGRRGQRRYFTADAIENGHGSALGKTAVAATSSSAGIRKRFTWNNFVSKSKSADETPTVLRANSNCLSSDSFCSSSGVSSSSSQICISPENGESGNEELSNFVATVADLAQRSPAYGPGKPSAIAKTQLYSIRSIEPSNTAARHVSRVAVGEGDFGDGDGASSEGGTSSRASPTSPNMPPSPVPRIFTEPPTPNNMTPVSGTPPSVGVRVGPSANGVGGFCRRNQISPVGDVLPAVKAHENKKTSAVNENKISKEELLKLILENKLEASDV